MAQSSPVPSPPYTVTGTSVRQGRFEAIALSRDSIVSTYPRAAREVRFRFSINGAENEFPPGTEHTIYLRPTDGKVVTPLYRFGTESAPPPPRPEDAADSEEGIASVTFRVDLRHVHASLRRKGYYDPPLGARIAKGSIHSVFVLGDPEPLTWDYAALRPGSPLELRDPDGDGIYEGTVAIATDYTRPRMADGRALWARRLELAGFPSLSSSQPLQDALYRLSLEELRQLVRDDGALSAGAKWPGVWTRDISLAAILSLAVVAPDATRRSLLAKVDSAGRIIQDTGTGGSWPVSTDRMVWALAAWEVYAVTGDRSWLRQACDIIRRSAQADLHAAHDAETGLFRGESSFLDWREQSYPRWMQPADIYQSRNLGTNAIHFAAYRVLADMARALDERDARWEELASGVARGLNERLWQPKLGWYGQFLYGRVHLALSPRAEALGNALVAIYGAADTTRRRELLSRAPVVEFGTPTFWPYIAGERFYHNATIWPFVTAYWTWAAAEARHSGGVQHGLDANTRAAALFLTNKENMVASTGHFDGTALNSDRQLWSVAGTLAATIRVLMGMRLESDGLVFRPVVPPSYAGERTLSGLRYRSATLTITVKGHGDAVAEMRLNGRVMDSARLPATLTGAHTVEIRMNDRWAPASVNVVENRFAPATPRAEARGKALRWNAVAGATSYRVFRNGRPFARTKATSIQTRTGDGLEEYQVLAVNQAGVESFLSEPVRVVPGSMVITAKPANVELERIHPGFTGGGYARLSIDGNTSVAVPVRIQREGVYVIDLRYANGNGPVNTSDKVAIRTLLVDGDTLGVAVLPQRGSGRWDDWGWSNALRVRLSAGTHTLSVIYSPLDANMNMRENSALLDLVRLTRVASMAAVPPQARR